MITEKQRTKLRIKPKDYDVKSISLDKKGKIGYVVKSPFCNGLAYLDCDRYGLFYKCEQTGKEFVDCFIGDISVAVQRARIEKKKVNQKKR